MPRVLVIGFGNRLRGDDAAGPLAADKLAEECRDEDEIRCEARPQLPPELAQDVSEADAVIFLDADAQAEPGTIHRRDIRPTADGSLATCHSLSPTQLITLARSVYGSAPRAVLLSIGAENLHYEQDLTETVRDALPDLVDRAAAVARKLSRESAEHDSG